MILIFLCISLLAVVHPVECRLGQAVEIVYSIPDGWSAEKMASSPDWEIVRQKNDTLTLIPLALDTIYLPEMACFDDTMSMIVKPPLLIVTRTMPDTTWNITMFPVPLEMNVPPGFPEDYLHRLEFWNEWGPAPGRNNLLLIGGGVLIIAIALAAYFIFRKRRKGILDDDDKPQITLVEKAQKLLTSPNYASGNWTELYREIEEVLREITAGRFSIFNTALTIYQLKRELGKTKNGKKFLKEADEILREIQLQRYASWGSSRLRSERFIRMLASLAEKIRK